MSTLFEDLKKRFEHANCEHDANYNRYPHNVKIDGDFGGEILSKPLVKCAVLILLFRQNNQFHIMFTVRSMKLKSFPGEICFPGGKFDPAIDNSVEETAQREALEEIGLLSKNYKKFCQMCPFITMNGHHISAIFGLICHDSSNGDPFEDTADILENLHPNPDEVDSILTFPLAFFNDTPVLTGEKEILDWSKILLNLPGHSDYFTDLLSPFPDYFQQVFLKLSDTHFIYGFNMFYCFVVMFLATDDKQSVQLDSAEINRENLVEFVRNMNKVSYIKFIIRKNKELNPYKNSKL